MTPQETGKWFESQVTKMLKQLLGKEPIYYHRLLDSHSAGRLVQPQPSDLLFCSARMGTIYLELKSSHNYTSAKQAGQTILRPTQLGKAQLLIRAGQVPMVLFYDYQNHEVELWLTECLISDNSMREKKPIVRVSFDNLLEIFTNNLM